MQVAYQHLDQLAIDARKVQSAIESNKILMQRQVNAFPDFVAIASVYAFQTDSQGRTGERACSVEAPLTGSNGVQSGLEASNLR